MREARTGRGEGEGRGVRTEGGKEEELGRKDKRARWRKLGRGKVLKGKLMRPKCQRCQTRIFENLVLYENVKTTAR